MRVGLILWITTIFKVLGFSRILDVQCFKGHRDIGGLGLLYFALCVLHKVFWLSPDVFVLKTVLIDDVI